MNAKALPRISEPRDITGHVLLAVDFKFALQNEKRADQCMSPARSTKPNRRPVS